MKIPAKNLAKDYRDFLTKSNLVELATAVVVGNAIGKVVDSVVRDLLMPVVAVVTPAGQWTQLTLDVWRLHVPWGHVVASVVDFLTIATVVFLISKALIRRAPPPPTKTCPKCREGIHLEATRCKFCTADL